MKLGRLCLEDGVRLERVPGSSNHAVRIVLSSADASLEQSTCLMRSMMDGFEAHGGFPSTRMVSPTTLHIEGIHSVERFVDFSFAPSPSSSSSASVESIWMEDIAVLGRWHASLVRQWRWLRMRPWAFAYYLPESIVVFNRTMALHCAPSLLLPVQYEEEEEHEADDGKNEDEDEGEKEERAKNGGGTIELLTPFKKHGWLPPEYRQLRSIPARMPADAGVYSLAQLIDGKGAITTRWPHSPWAHALRDATAEPCAERRIASLP